MIDKIQIRKKILSIRNNMNNKIREIKNQKIFSILISNKKFLNSKKIGIYYSVYSEVDTLRIINFCLKKDKIVLIPKIINKSSMNFVEINELNIDKFEKNNLGILEPKSNLFFDKKDIDLIIVPLVAFDKENNRIGYGKGFYDRYLFDFNGSIIGLAYKEQFIREEIINSEIHDIKIDEIIYA